MSDKIMQPKLWTPRPVEETRQVYAEWADRYDADVKEREYMTPGRVAEAIARHVAPGKRILDFGCGTGLSGQALKDLGLGPLHGTDITQEMVDVAREKDIYEKLWVGTPGEAPGKTGDYDAIVATGVISLGAAPPQTLDMLIGVLSYGGILALSFNQPSLEDGSYDARLDQLVEDGKIKVLFRENGPHLKGMTADVLVLRRE